MCYWVSVFFNNKTYSLVVVFISELLEKICISVDFEKNSTFATTKNNKTYLLCSISKRERK